MTTYTVYDTVSDVVLRRGLTAVEAAQEILVDDGRRYELRADHTYARNGEPQWLLFVGRGGESHDSLIGAYAPTAEAAWPEIADRVIARTRPSDPIIAMPDAEFDAMRADADADAA